MDGRTRLLVPGRDIEAFRNQSIRIIAANANDLTKRNDVYARYLAAYRETIDWMYSDPASIDAYAKWAEVTPELARKVRADFLPKEIVNPDRIDGLDAMMEDAVAYKLLTAPLTKEQLAVLFQRPGKK
jgi:NitT/TauT family transport system substrate-binding protein